MRSSPDDPSDEQATSPAEDLEDLYENAPCGYLSMLPNGRIVKVNRTFLNWAGYKLEEMLGKSLRDFLPVAGRMFYETHFAPLLRIQGFFNEVALDIVRRDGSRVPVLANALERRDGSGELLFTRLTLFPAADRRRFERGLVEAQEVSTEKIKSLEEASDLREQFVAVLGHDLRNPLASIASGTRMLSRDGIEKQAQILALMAGSVTRMSGLINDVMDFARGRLGGGIGVELKPSATLDAALGQVVAELEAAFPEREIASHIGPLGTVTCDAPRLAQMASNLLANALTHGSNSSPVRLGASTADGVFELYVANSGDPIPQEKQARLFRPFFRGEESDVREAWDWDFTSPPRSPKRTRELSW
jgi:sigma-B regulation protein RsbU (phosphoserine phosphatase)